MESHLRPDLLAILRLLGERREKVAKPRPRSIADLAELAELRRLA